MVSSVLILVFSCVLLVYWFRYTCLLILNAREGDARAAAVARANHLRFVEVREKLRTPLESTPMDSLQQLLERDFRVLQYLLEHAAGLGITSLEEHLLKLDYRVMQVWYWMTRRSNADQAKKALEEMSSIVHYFAQKMGERASVYSQL